MSVPENSSEPPLNDMAGLPPVAPDFAEAGDYASTLDNIVPTRGYQMLPMVGLGGSAGGIEALQNFFTAMPLDSGMVFVVIMHLSPEHESTLPALIQRATKMKVQEAQDGERVEPNCVYVIPPGKHLSAIDGHLRLVDILPVRGRRVAVDLFFRSLADTHGPHAAAIILSGADGDGAIGIKRIKERGGLTIAQDPDEAGHSGMPRAAIGTGMVDWVLRVEQMPQHLLDYRRMELRLRLPPEEGPQPAALVAATQGDSERALRELLAYLRAQTGRDFSYYKRATILRRISRRMQVNGIDDLPAYLNFCRTHQGESGALLQDLLISVTNFFRDRDAFEVLRKNIPDLFKGKTQSGTIRAWMPACATGEEAYSIAILLAEHARQMESPPVIQVFATDLNNEVIQNAREGTYPETIAADVPEEWLRRYFIKEHKGYRVRREIREVVLFAMHDLLKDSPFSRLDLISCRNLLIYLNRDAQTRAFDIFHFALRAEGQLFLGSSESIDESSTLFSIIDKKARLYSARPAARSVMPIPLGRSTLSLAMDARDRNARGSLLPPRDLTRVPGLVGAPGSIPIPPTQEDRMSWTELHFKLIERFAPPSVIVNTNYDIVHLSQNAGRFLQFAGGEPTVNLLRAVDPMLRIELRAALYRAAHSGEPVELLGVPAHVKGVNRVVNLRVAPARDLAPDYLLVVFEDREADPTAEEPKRPQHEPVVEHLERELEQLKSNLRDTVEQYEASTEELKASNEELQAMNEELRSATEELETGREELQSINEELTTVNQELKSKVEELGHANGDLNNLMASTAIASVFLDRELQIMRYTPSAVSLFNLIATDVGRPLSHLTHHLDYPELNADAESVLGQLLRVEREVREDGGNWFLARLLPYRTIDDRIAGVVLTFVDITERKKASEALREGEERYRALFNSIDEAFAIYEMVAAEVDVRPDFRLLEVNPAFIHLSGQPGIVGQTMRDVQPNVLLASMDKYTEVVRSGESTRFEVYESTLNRWFDTFVTRVGEFGSRKVAIVFSDISARKNAEAALRDSEERLRLMVESAREYAIITLDLERRVTGWSAGAQRLLGYKPEEMLGKSADIIFTPEDIAAGAPVREAQRAITVGRASDERWHRRKDGTVFWGSGDAMLMHDAAATVIGLVKIFRDQTEAREIRTALEESRTALARALREMEAARDRAETAARAKDQFLATLSHELRTPLNPVLMIASEAVADLSLPDETRAAFETVRKNIELEARLIDDLLDLTRVSRGKMSLEKQAIDLHDVVREAVENVKAQAAEKNLEITLRLEAPSHHTFGDPVRLQQIVGNLLSNAVKFTPPGGRVNVSTAAGVIAGEACIHISDTGIGMTPEEIARAFRPFEQGDHARVTGSSTFGGLGLGLAISEKLAELHGGRIEVTSGGRGAGCEFIVALPTSAAGTQTNPPFGKESRERSHGRGLRLLLVEDHGSTRKVLTQLLVRRGFTVAATDTVANAVDAAQNQPFDLAVLDLGLPDGDGYALLLRLREIQPDLVGIALSGYGSSEDVHRSLSAGFRDHLIKPVSAAKLDAAIRKLDLFPR